MSDDMKAELERLRAENEALKNKKSGNGVLSMKVSEKGALSVYGMGRFPVTLYKEQWLKLLSIAEELKKFIADNNTSLNTVKKDTPNKQTTIESTTKISVNLIELEHR